MAKWSIPLTIAAMCLGPCMQTLAWAGNDISPNATGQTTLHIKKKHTSYSTRFLAKAVTLPDIPNFPDRQAKLIRAVQFPSLGSGNTAFLQSFAVKQPADQVRNWYASALASFGWKNMPDGAQSQMIVRHAGGETCEIMVFATPSDSQGYKTFLQIRFTKSTTSIN